MELVNTCFMKKYEEIAQIVDQRTQFFFGDIDFFLEVITLLCLFLSQNWNNINSKDFLLESLLSRIVRCCD